jgi:hypothetical protein
MDTTKRRLYSAPELVTYGTVEDLTATGDQCFGDEYFGKGFGVPNDATWRVTLEWGDDSVTIGGCS